MKHVIAAAVLAVSISLPRMEATESITIRTDKVLHETGIDRLLGGNVALWYPPETLSSTELRASLDGWHPTLLRLPGGSWSDEFHWNGNGVRKGDSFDRSKLADGRWQVDYSSYAPGFRLAKTDGSLSDFHGNIDVLGLHEFVKSRGAEAVVTINAGTGTPQMAAEWVRWAKERGYKVAYWEIGNELDGEWELGHLLNDGKRMDAATYVSRFKEIVSSMKAVDPTIKTGGPACSSDQLSFVEELLRDGGGLVDFISFHSYPVLGAHTDEQKQLGSAADIKKAVERIRGWIAHYQPQRRDKIAIGVTEWHKQVMETRATVDLTSGIWACLFIGAMAESGTDFANVWDMFSNTATGGHGLFDKSGKAPRAFYHAMTLWRDMGNQWLAGENTGSLRCFPTLRDGVVELLIVNPARNADHFSLSLDGRKAAGPLPARRFSQREYFWNPITNQPEWSCGARSIVLMPSGDATYQIGPMSVLRVSVPLKGTMKRGAAEAEPGKPKLDILLPQSAPSDLPVEGFVVVRDSENRPYAGTLPKVKLTVTGAKADTETLDTSDVVARFELTGGSPGEARVTATAPGGLQASGTVKLTAVEERQVTLWGFPNEASVSSLETNFSLALDHTARPNQTVASAVLSNAEGKANQNTLAAIREFPQSLDKKRIGGVCGKISASGDLACDDPKAAVQIVLQSNLNHWMQIGEIPLSDLKGSWKDMNLRLTDASTLDAMGELYSLRLQLKAHKPVNGRIYFDDLGFILRAH